jgi:phage tail sheath protein FI
MAPFTFSLICIPAAAELATTAEMVAVYSQALTVAQTFRAFLIVDIPRFGAQSVSFTDAASFMTTWYADASIQTLFAQGIGDHGAVYFPRLQVPDPLNGFAPRTVGVSGTVAGIYGRTDANRGVWKAPAGTDAGLVNATVSVVPATGLPSNMTDQENGALNPFGVNAIRNFPVFGTIVWGARTMNGADAAASQWKYVPVRRIALYIEESLVQGSKFIVFEPNDEPLWAEIRKVFTAFMQTLFLQGAFQGSSPAQAYFVRCDHSTTTQADIDAGVVNILVGFAPLKPAEFVVISIQQIAGQTTT